jgi:hypothetical protein
MGELLLLTTIVTLVILTIRRGRPVILDNPVIINRPGKYHITLAPQLNRAQNFIEGIAKQIGDIAPNTSDSATQYFAVHDEKICASGEKLYLLAVALRGGMLYFQAINPQPLLYDSDSHLKTVSEFSAKVLAQHPCVLGSDAQSGRVMHDAVLAVGQAMQIKVEALAA